MYCTRKIDDDIIWVGADNRRNSLFEALYSIPRGVSYNSYLILDEKTALVDTADRAVTDVFLENVEYALNGKTLDYLIVQHMEPDHSATLIDVLMRHPECTVVCNKMTFDMIKAFKGVEVEANIVKEGDVLDLGRHKLTFISAPMVHWPEVTVTFDTTGGTLFSADAFGTFGALNGAIFSDEVDFERDYLDEARRYYANIVGKYGAQVERLLGKVSKLNVNKICPLHGPVWRENIEYYVNKYLQWATYTPEKTGVTIAYASIYGNTENVANYIACRLRERGVECVMHDVSVSEHSQIIADVFKYSHILFASATYNAGAFIGMEHLLNDIAVHNLKGRKISFVENGSWAANAIKRMKEILSDLKETTFVGEDVSFKSAIHGECESVDRLVDAIIESI